MEFSDRLKNLEANAIREIFKLVNNSNVISFAGGFPSKDCLPVDEISQIAVELLNSDRGRTILQYGATEGYAPLLESGLAYARRAGVRETDIQNALVISGGQQGIDLTFKAFLNKGDCILVEDPTYLAVLHILKTYECVAYGVRSDEDGINIEDLERKMIAHKPKILYLVPDFSNPTGKTLSLEKRKAILALAVKYNVLIIEDNPYGELRFEGEFVPAIKSLDTNGNVVYVTSFSKTISPGLRTGIAVADPKIIGKMCIGKQAVDVHTSLLSQAIVDEYLLKNLLPSQLDKIRPYYKLKKDAMVVALDKYMPTEFSHTNPKGGLFIWGEFDKKTGIDTLAVFKEVVAHNVAYVPGVSFFAEPCGKNNTLRFNFSGASLEQIDEGAKIMGNVFKNIISEVK